MGWAGDRWHLGCGDKCRVDRRRPRFDLEMAEKGFWEELLTLGNPCAPALGFMFIFMYLFGGHLFMSLG